MSNATATLVGQNLGAGKPDRAEKSVWLTAWMNTAFMACVMVTFLFFGRSVASIFTDDPAVLKVAADCLRVMSYGYLVYAWGMVLTNAFNGAGDTISPTILNIACFWVVQIPLAWLLATRWGVGYSGVFWAVIFSDGLLAVLALGLFLRGNWKRMVV